MLVQYGCPWGEKLKINKEWRGDMETSGGKVVCGPPVLSWESHHPLCHQHGLLLRSYQKMVVAPGLTEEEGGAKGAGETHSPGRGSECRTSPSGPAVYNGCPAALTYRSRPASSGGHWVRWMEEGQVMCCG